jgi:hypothetical protein
VTTGAITLNSRLWHLHFDDLDDPEDGGTIEILLNATKGRMFDNITIDRRGRLLLQEDTGNDPWVSKIWMYGIDRRSFVELAHHDQALFQPDFSPGTFLTQDEESSGIIDAEDVLGPGWFLFDVQVHKVSADPELVEGGQLVSLFVPTEMH